MKIQDTTAFGIMIFLAIAFVGCAPTKSDLKHELAIKNDRLLEQENELASMWKDANEQEIRIDELKEQLDDYELTAGQGVKIATTARVDDGVSTPSPPPPVYFFFDFDSAEIQSWIDLEALRYVKFILDRFSYHLIIDGYACTVGSHEYNILLSEKRAMALFDHLVAEGIDKSRLHVYFYGEESACGECDFDRRGMVTFVEK